MSVPEADHRIWVLVSDVPKVHTGFAVIAIFLNIFLPGFGTILVGCLGDKDDRSMSKI